MKQQVTIFWFRRDLRLHDNTGLYHALCSGLPVLPVFIFDTNILEELPDKKDKRVQFIYNHVKELHSQLQKLGSTILVEYGTPEQAFKKLIKEYSIQSVYTNRDYEPYARQRDREIADLLRNASVSFYTYKDQVIFEKDEVIKDDGTPYTIFTPYSKKWKAKLSSFYLKPYPTKKYFKNFLATKSKTFPSLASIGFMENEDAIFPPEKVNDSIINNYSNNRNYPAVKGTSRLSIHLRFGTISIRELAAHTGTLSETYLNELIWREFYMMILWHFPQVVTHSFKPDYDNIKWRNNKKEFELWCNGMTGFPIVDAGMRELNETGYMHNRVRMITACFLTKDLLIDWRWGEAYFAEKLLDYELASNNGGWQWAASTGCDAAPYFRIFNPTEQARKFDPELKYIRKWIPELDSFNYPSPVVDHSEARLRALGAYKAALKR